MSQKWYKQIITTCRDKKDKGERRLWKLMRGSLVPRRLVDVGIMQIVGWSGLMCTEQWMIQAPPHARSIVQCCVCVGLDWLAICVVPILVGRLDTRLNEGPVPVWQDWPNISVEYRNLRKVSHRTGILSNFKMQDL